MALILMYITNKKEVAKTAESCGVDWIFVDLEINGKGKRQGHLDTVISKHNIEDVERVAKSLSKAKLLVRVNPIYSGLRDEIERVINGGADIIMLPFFKTREEVEIFAEYVDGRVKTCLLLETPQAVEDIDSILSVPGVDYVHIGLNDLHLGYGMRFMFELLANGVVEMLSNKLKERGITFGFGGIARLGYGKLPAEYILAEHYRLGSSMAILSRSFCDAANEDNVGRIEDIFKVGVAEIRDYEAYLQTQAMEFFEDNLRLIKQKVKSIASSVP